MSVSVEETSMMCYFVMTTSSGEIYPMEVPTLMGGRDLVNLFLDAMGR